MGEIYKIGIGGDIPAGRYTIVYEHSDKKSGLSDYYWLDVSIIDAEGNRLSHKEMTTEYTDKTTVSFEFPEGCIFKVRNDGAVVRLVKTEGIVFK